MTFAESISSVYRNYFRFSGRASRSEYWFFQLFVTLYFFSTGTVATLLLPISEMAALAFGLVNMIAVLGTLIPLLAVQIRRLHDLGVSGFWYGSWFLVLVIAGAASSMSSTGVAFSDWYNLIIIFQTIWALILWVACMQKGTHGLNRFGDDPLYDSSGNDNQSALSRVARKSKSPQSKIHSSAIEKEAGFENKISTKDAALKKYADSISDSTFISEGPNRLNGKEYDYFEKAFEEIERDNKHKGIWAKAYSVASSDESAKKLYIKYRTEYLIEEATQSTSESAVLSGEFNEKFESKGLRLINVNDDWEVVDSGGNIMNTCALQSLSQVKQWIVLYNPNTIDSYDKRGYTRLMESALAGDFKEVRLLLALGASPKIKDRDTKDNNAFSIAARKKGESAIHLDIFNLLWKRG